MPLWSSCVVIKAGTGACLCSGFSISIHKEYLQAFGHTIPFVQITSVTVALRLVLCLLTQISAMKSQKELKDEYKMKKFRIGVFQIRNTVNEKIFIDSSVNLDAIWNRHRSELNAGGHRNEALQAEWNQFGADQFSYEILSEIRQDDDSKADYPKEAQKLAELFIDELKPFDEKDTIASK
jgi:hypothetical protein